MPRFVLPAVACAILIATAIVVPRQLEEFPPRVDASTDSLILEDAPETIAYDRASQLFASDEFVLVGITGEEVFTAEGIAAIESIHADLAGIEAGVPDEHGKDPGLEVWSVARKPVAVMLNRSLQDDTPPFVRLSFAMNRKLTFELHEKYVDLDKAKEELRKHALWSNNLVSEDGKAIGILVWLPVLPEAGEALRKKLELFDERKLAETKLAEAEDGEARATAQAEVDAAEAAIAEFWPEWVAAEDARKDERIRIVRQVRDKVQGLRDDGVEARASGVPSLVVEMVEAIERDMGIFLAASAGFLLLFLLAVFRRPRWMLLPLVVTATTACWTVALLYMLDKRITVITSNVPSLLLVIGLAHSIHLIVRWRELRARFPDEPKPARVGRLVRGLIWPCLFTATTTGAGFLSLYYAGSRPIIDFGFLMAIGVGLAFALSFVFLPAAMLVLPGEESGRLERSAQALTGVGRFSLDRRGLVAVAAALFATLSVIGITRLDVEARFIDYFSERSEIHKGLTFIDKHLGGTSSLEVIIRSDEPNAFHPSHPRAGENLARASEVVAWLQKEEKIGAVMSYPGLVDELLEDGDGNLPENPDRKRGATILLTQLDTKSLSGYVVTEEKVVAGKTVAPFSTIRITARARETDTDLRRNELLTELREHLAEKFPEEQEGTHLDAEVTGMFVLYATMLDSLVESQVTTSVIALAAIFLMLALLFRSVAAAVLALIPNAIPILFVIGAMGWSGIPLDMATVMIASVSLGIGIDCAIHYLFRYREEVAVDGDVRGAVLRSHGSIGTSIFYTSLTSVAGFSVLAFSEFRPNAYFGLLTGFAMIAALFAMLTLLPALISWAKPFRKAMLAGQERAKAAVEPSSAEAAVDDEDAEPAPEA